jgi:hypothetical protein
MISNFELYRACCVTGELAGWVIGREIDKYKKLNGSLCSLGNLLIKMQREVIYKRANVL